MFAFFLGTLKESQWFCLKLSYSAILKCLVPTWVFFVKLDPEVRLPKLPCDHNIKSLLIAFYFSTFLKYKNLEHFLTILNCMYQKIKQTFPFLSTQFLLLHMMLVFITLFFSENSKDRCLIMRIKIIAFG